MFKILSLLAALTICSCKDKIVIEHTIEVEVIALKGTGKSSSSQAEMMTKEFLETEFTIIDSEGNERSTELISWEAKRKEEPNQKRLSMRFMTEDDGKSYLYIEPGCFRNEAKVVKESNGTYVISISQKSRAHAMILLGIEDYECSSVIVTLDAEKNILSIVPKKDTL